MTNGPDDTLDGMLEEVARAAPLSISARTGREGWVDLPQAGDVVGGHYEIVREIARGGMGAVFEARDRELGRRVAVKIVLLTGDANERAVRLQQLDREARLVAQLRHENIVTIYARGTWDGPEGPLPFLVLELLQGVSLYEAMCESPPTIDEAVRIVADVAGALAHAHERRIVHRDLKPGNVFLGYDGRVAVLDFGLASTDSDRRSLISALERAARTPFAGPSGLPGAGTPAFMAPEQYRGERVDPRIDIWAAGVILFEVLTGQLPFPDPESILDDRSAPRARSVNGKVPAAIDDIIAHALNKDARRRLPTARRLREELVAAASAARADSGAPFGSAEPAYELGRAATIDTGPPDDMNSAPTVVHSLTGPSRATRRGPTQSTDVVVPQVARARRWALGFFFIALAALGVLAGFMFGGIGDAPAPAAPTITQSAAAAAVEPATVDPVVAPAAHGGEVAPERRDAEPPPPVEARLKKARRRPTRRAAARRAKLRAKAEPTVEAPALRPAAKPKPRRKESSGGIIDDEGLD